MKDIEMKKIITSQWWYLLLGLATYVMCVNFSKDWINYEWFYGLLEKASWMDFWNDFSIFKEPLYNFTVKFFSPLLGFSGLILIATVSLLWIKLRVISDIILHKFIGVFFYTCLYLFLFEGTQLRIAYATTFIVLGLYYLQKKRYLLSMSMILIASQIQLTTILFAFLYILYFSNPAAWITYVAFLIAPLLIIFKISTFSLLKYGIEVINPKYLFYWGKRFNSQNSTGLYFYFIAFYWLLLLFIEWKLASLLHKDKFKLTLQRLCMIGVILMCVFYDHVVVGARLGELLLLPIVLLLSWLYLQSRHENSRLSIGLLIGCSCLYFMARFIYLYPNALSLLSA
jgi:hypothetical protein